MKREELIDKLSAVDALINVVIMDVLEVAPIVLDYVNPHRPFKKSVRDRLEQAKEVISKVMDEA